MPKIVILGSCKLEPYIVLFMPNKLDSELYERDHEQAYLKARKVVYPAITEADIVIVLASEGIGEHTLQDMKYADSLRKRIVIITNKTVEMWNPKE